MPEDPLAEDAARCRLAAAVYQHVLNQTESFAPDGIGLELAYLLGAIVTGGMYAVRDDNPLILLLRDSGLMPRLAPLLEIDGDG